MPLKRYQFLIASYLLFSTGGLSAQTMKPYTQQITGTKLQFDMVPVKGGTFAMGSPDGEKGRSADEGPKHTVKISPFYIGKYEVPWDLFEPFVYKDFEAGIGTAKPEVDAVARPTKPYLDMTFGMGKQGFPAVGMTQYNAVQFCKWLYARTGVFYRLPTEAEWEYAARAGSDKAYSFGDDAAKLEEYAWLKSNSGNKTHPMGTKKPNAWGLYDMYGNVAEWTIDQYEPNYASFAGKNSTDPVVKADKLYPNSLRGGSFQDEPAALRSASRLPSNPDWKRIDPQIPKSNWWFPEAPFVGLRVVRPVTLPSKAEIEAYYNQKPVADL